MQFKEYMHIERLGVIDVEGIDIGTCHIFPKIDGTNASIWCDDNGNVQTGSRTRWLSNGQNDNAGFRQSVTEDPQFSGIIKALKDNPKFRFYGEWLVPHTLKTYRQEAWRKFYVFDVTLFDGEFERFLRYEEYSSLCQLYNINYIPCLAIVRNPTMEDYVRISNQNNYLVEDGKGTGEGIVIKNYDFRNTFGRTVWAKLVTSEFKEKHIKEMGSPEKTNFLIEDEIAQAFCTKTLVDKTVAKIKLESEGWSSKLIPRLIETVYHDLIVEDIYEILKKFKSPTINFKVFRNFVIQQIKQHVPELFN